jgi:diadenosine tetraphosphate (Ap4A) HIT family hydrolase
MAGYNEARVRRCAALLVLAAACALRAGTERCACDVARPFTLEAHSCALCRETEKQPATEWLFFLKDNSPYKPNRWLILPRSHAYDGPLPFSKMTAAQRADFWKAAIKRARAMWGDAWGLALNGDQVRSQCHLHVHIGRLVEGVEQGKPLIVDGPDGIPAPADGSGLWIHPVGNKLHVHLGEQRTETVLVR